MKVKKVFDKKGKSKINPLLVVKRKNSLGLFIEKFSDNNFAIIITTIYFLICLIGILNHEMWRDEYQAWLLSKYSYGLNDLINNQKYEGHLILWYLILYVFTRIFENPSAMQFLHIILASLSIFILTRYSPFDRKVKILISFGYFFLFEYSLISRDYILVVLFLFITCSLINKNIKRPILLSIVIILLANTQIYGLFLAGLMCVAILYLLIDNKYDSYKLRFTIKSFFLPLLILIMGFTFAIYQFYNMGDTHYSEILRWKGGLTSERFIQTSSHLLSAYIPIPPTSVINFWGKTIISELNGTLQVFLSLIIVSFFFVYFFIKKPALIMFSLGTIGLFYFIYNIIPSGLRYYGCFILIFIASDWIYKILPEKNTKRHNKFKIQLFNKANFVFITILLAQLIAGVIAYYKGFTLPFSNIEKAGLFINEKKLSNQLIYGSIDYIVSPLSALIKKPIYFPERDTTGYFIIWDDKRKMYPPVNIVIEKAINLISNPKDSLLMILSSKLMVNHGNKVEEFSDTEFNGRSIKYIGKADDECITGDEVFYFYEMKRVK